MILYKYDIDMHIKITEAKTIKETSFGNEHSSSSSPEAHSSTPLHLTAKIKTLKLKMSFLMHFTKCDAVSLE